MGKRYDYKQLENNYNELKKTLKCYRGIADSIIKKYNISKLRDWEYHIEKYYDSLNICKKSFAQQYNCEVIIIPPWNKEKTVCVDVCMAKEILSLWSLGIKTTGCCCGGHANTHGDMAYISVVSEDVGRMKELGYCVKYNEMYPESEDTFYPKRNL